MLVAALMLAAERLGLSRRARRRPTSRAQLDAFVTKTVTPCRGRATTRPDRRDRERDAELDRARESRARALPRRDAAAARASSACRCGSPSAASRPTSTRRRARTRRDDVEAIELNLSCPNVDEAAESAAEIVAACRAATDEAALREALAGAWDLAEVARAVQAAGADGLSLVNTIRGLALDARRSVRGLRAGSAATRVRR